MLELVIATKNKGKLREIIALLKDLPIKVTSLADYPNAPEIIEDGKSFSENALKKAKIISKFTGKLTLGEDSGIEVKALNWVPGIYSARYSGEGATDEKNNAKLMADLKDVPSSKRQARYRCFAALVDSNKTIDIADGKCPGIITTQARGTNGFGYDPYFLIKKYNKTFGELDPSIKAKISHRAKAFKKIKMALRQYLKVVK